MADNRPSSIHIPEYGFKQLVVVVEYVDRLSEILSALDQSAAYGELTGLAKTVNAKTGVSVVASQMIVDWLSTMRGLMQRWKLTADELITSLDVSIDAQADTTWKSQHQPAWVAVKSRIIPALQSISVDSPISVRQKLRDLTVAHQNLFTDASLITDLRPVYNSVGDKIIAMVLTHMLRISYQDGPRQRRIEFALDAADVAKLSKVTERAQMKMETARKTCSGDNWKLVIAGEGAIAPQDEVNK